MFIFLVIFLLRDTNRFFITYVLLAIVQQLLSQVFQAVQSLSL